MPSSKPEKGVNDLATLFPEVGMEADGWDPTFVLSLLVFLGDVDRFY